MNTFLPQVLAASEGFDLQQVIFVVVFLAIAFFQWLFKLIKEKGATAEREKQLPPSAEEIEARRRAWQQQTAPVEEPVKRPVNPSTPPPPMPASGGGLGELIETLRKNIEEQQQPRPVYSAPVPAPPPMPAPVPHVPVHVPAPHSVFVKEPEVAYGVKHTPALATTHIASNNPLQVLPTLDTARTSVRSSQSAHPIAQFLRTTHGYRRAFILKEVLGTPKALLPPKSWPNES